MVQENDPLSLTRRFLQDGNDANAIYIAPLRTGGSDSGLPVSDLTFGIAVFSPGERECVSKT